MPVGKKQLLRLIRLVAQLKENRYPNCTSFAAQMQKADLEENLNVACTAKTIFRDIQTLKNDFGAPIEFDRKHNGYYLKHRNWSFFCPQTYEDSEMLAAVLGARIAEHIFPPVFRKQIRHAVDMLLSRNDPDFLDKTQVDSLVIIPSNRTEIENEIFTPLFYAWQNHKVCIIEYLDSRENISQRRFEPHSLAFFDGIWYSKGFCYQRNSIRTLVLARMRSVTLTSEDFLPNGKIINSVSEDDIFGADIVQNAVIRCDAYLAKFIRTRPLHTSQKIKKIENGECELSILRIPRYRLLTWIMHQCGRAVLIEPAELKNDILKFTQLIAQKHKERNENENY